MDRYQKRVLKLREYVLGHNSKNNEVAGQPTIEVNEGANAIAYDGMTKTQIGELLTERGIEYNSRDNRDKLVELLLGSD